MFMHIALQVKQLAAACKLETLDVVDAFKPDAFRKRSFTRSNKNYADPSKMNCDDFVHWLEQNGISPEDSQAFKGNNR